MIHRRPTRSDSTPIAGRIARVVSVWSAEQPSELRKRETQRVARIERQERIHHPVEHELRRLRTAGDEHATVPADLEDALPEVSPARAPGQGPARQAEGG